MQDKVHENLEGTKECEGVVWDEVNQRCVKTQFYIQFTKNKEIKYTTADGSILRIDQNIDISKKPQIMTNLEQIKYLKWSTSVSSIYIFKKVNKQTATWKGETLKGVGGLYSKDGKKYGQWKDLFENYWDHAQIYEVGEYLNDQKKGIWKYIYQDKVIAGGTYEQGLKNGKWIDLNDGFKEDQIQVTFEGEYKKGKKVGQWNINYSGDNQKQFYSMQSNFLNISKIGGGSYNIQGFKNGFWIELSDGFKSSSQIFYKGEYQNGRKIGQWDIYDREDSLNTLLKIGGGSYSQDLKNGKWVELSDGYYLYFTLNSFNSISSSQVLYKGEYKNGLKVGLWDICYKQWNNKLLELIGGGLYDSQGLKNGMWIDLSYGFQDESQVTYHCFYKNGKKIGQWDIKYRLNQNKYWEQIGGGTYEQGLKNGQWSIYFCCASWNKVIYKGEYKNCKKIGQWIINYKDHYHKPWQQIGGGCYDENYLKNGRWIDLSDSFRDNCQVTFSGEYNNGQKVGKWDIILVGQSQMQINNEYIFQQIGGGSYDQFTQKNGMWIDLGDGFKDSNQVTCYGEYKNGKKIGRWKFYEKGKLINKFTQYDND